MSLNQLISPSGTPIATKIAKQVSVDAKLANPYSKVLTLSDVNKVFVIPAQDAAATYTVPTAAAQLAGCEVTFILGATPGFTVTFNQVGGANFYATVFSTATGGDAVGLSPAGGSGFIRFAATALPGDRMVFFCDGTTWYCNAVTRIANGINFTP